jgi:sulfate permease, SulP family
MKCNTLCIRSFGVSVVSLVREQLSFTPFRTRLSAYCVADFWRDIGAAITVALLTLPTALACALVADLPLSTGIFSAIFGTIIAGAFGHSRHLVCGPSNAVAILLQATIGNILFSYYGDVTGPTRDLLAFQVMLQLTLLVGFLQGIAALLRLGRLAQFVSRPVMNGYMLGVSFAIAIHQLYYLIGVVPADHLVSLYDRFLYLIGHVMEAHLATAIVGGASLALLLFMRRVSRRLPAAAIMLIVATLAVYFGASLGLNEVECVSSYGELHAGVPLFAPPVIDWQLFSVLLPSAFALAFLGTLEVTAICKSLGARSGQGLSINQEMLSLGIANLVSSFLGAMPSSGSFSRSSINFLSGARTRFAAVLGGVLVALLVWIFHGMIALVPLASLAAILLVGSWHIVDGAQLRLCMRTTRSDAFALLVTFASCLLFGLAVAFYVGVVISIALYLNKACSPDLVECVMGDDGMPLPVTDEERGGGRVVRFIDVGGELFFGAVDFFDATLRAVASDQETRVLILRLRNAHHLDATTCLALRQLHHYMTASGRLLILSGITQPVWEVMVRSSLLEQIGRCNLFVSDPCDPVGSTRKAFMRAHHWVKGNPL